MNHAETISSASGSYDWDAQIYGALSLASRVAASVTDRANVWRIAYHLHGLNKTLDSLFDKVHGVLEGKIAPDPKAEPVTPEQMLATANNLEHLHRTIEYVYEALRRSGLTNNSLTAGPLRKMRQHGEAVLDMAEWFELSGQPKEVEEIFNQAQQEKEKGELHNLTRV